MRKLVHFSLKFFQSSIFLRIAPSSTSNTQTNSTSPSREQPHLQCERRLHVQAAPREDPDGGGQGRERAGEEGDQEQGGRGPQARDRGRHRQDHEGQEAHASQRSSRRGGFDTLCLQSCPGRFGTKGFWALSSSSKV